MPYQGQGLPGVLEQTLLAKKYRFEMALSDRDKEKIRKSIRDRKPVKKK